jgi:nitrite reductase/ring-hydroxylating ferredoxin subunit
MSDQRTPPERERDDVLPSVEQVARLDAFLDQLGEEQQPAPHPMSAHETAERMVAAQLRLAREGAEEPTPEFLSALERTVTQAIAHEQRTKGRQGISRWRFLRAAAGAAAATGLVGAGVAADEVQRQLRQPHDLVAGPGRWYDIAATDELASGQMKAFAAGGVLGYLVNDGGRLHAVSAICTHMGCRLKPAQGGSGLRCLCHGSQFSQDGRVLAGLAPDPLPRIALHIESGRVYARGTAEDI